MAVGAGLIVGGALLLLAMSKKKSPASVPPETATPTQPAAQPNNPNASVNAGISAGLSLTTTLVPLVVKGITGAATGGGTTAGTAAATAAASSGFFSAGPLYVAAAIIIAVVATMVTQGISANITTKHYWQQMVVMGPNAMTFASDTFIKFIGQASRWYYAPGRPVPANIAATLTDTNARTYGAFRVVELSPGQLRDIGLTCLYLAAQILQAKNDALVRYYTYIGWNAQQMATAPFAQASPGLNVAATFSPDALRSVLAPLAMMFSAVRPPTMPGNPLFDAVAAPFTWPDLEPAAGRVLGADLARVTDAMRFTGTVKMLFLAAVEGYGGVGGSWQTFAETLASWVGWTAVKTVYWVTNTAAPYPLDTWWLVDYATGNRFAPLETHSDNILRLSVKGAPIMPNVPNSPVAGFGHFAGGECMGPGGTLVGCPAGSVKGPGAAHSGAGLATTRPPREAGTGGGSMLVPLGVAAAAVWFFTRERR